MNIDKMREEFELHYAHEFLLARGFMPTPDDMVAMREGDGYGSDRHYLNGYWKGWQASRESLVIELPTRRDCNFDDAATSAVGACRDAIHATGVKTK